MINWGLWHSFAAQLTIENGKLKIMVSPLATNLIHFRRKYLNFQLSTFNFQFAKRNDKLR